MAVTVRDLLKTDLMKDFKVIAGAGGLDQSIKGTEILDFEFTPGKQGYENRLFTGGTLVLSSLMFARNDPSLITEALKGLKFYGCRALAYRTVFIDRLPEDAVRYAEENNFPLLEFGGSAYFEDIIIAVGKLCSASLQIDRSVPVIRRMLHRPLSGEEREQALSVLNPHFRPYLRCYALRIPKSDEDRVKKQMAFSRKPSRVENSAFSGWCDGLFFVLSSFDHEEEGAVTGGMDPLAEDAVSFMGIDTRKAVIGASEVFRLRDGVDRGIRQAFWCCILADVRMEKQRNYDSLGIYKLLIPWGKDDGALEYMKEYLRPLFQENDQVLLETAVAYVRAEGDAQRAAAELFCHKNTIRYRVGRLQEKLDPVVGEKTFYRNLSSAVEIWILDEEAKKYLGSEWRAPGE